jgi:hypothetical protein
MALGILANPGAVSSAVQVPLAGRPGTGVAMNARLVRAALPATTTEHLPPDRVQHRMVPVADRDEVRDRVGAALVTRDQMMNMQVVTTAAPEEPADGAALTVTRENALADLYPGERFEAGRHRRSQLESYAMC